MEILLRHFVSLVWILAIMPTSAVGQQYIATATLMTYPPTGGLPTNLIGTITFTQNAGENKVSIGGVLKLANDFPWVGNTSIGFHIHSTSNFTSGCDSCGVHYNPESKQHGAPTDSNRHVGDLGNVVFDATSRQATVQMTDTIISLVGKQTVIGRSLVLHKGTDDLGKGGNDESLKTGNAGGRYACGPIVLVNDFAPGTGSTASALISKNQIAIVSLIGLCSIALQKLQW